MIGSGSSDKEEAFKFFKEHYTGKILKDALRNANKPPIARPVNKIKLKLIEQEKYRKAHPVQKVREESDKIRQLREELNNISTIRKERVFDSEPTEEEKLIIQKRVMLQQLQFKEYEKKDFYRKLDKITAVYSFLNEEEVKEALEDSKNDEEQVILNFTHQEYLPKIRRLIAYKYNDPEKIEIDNEQKEAYEKLISKRKNYVKKITSQDAKTRTYTYTRLRLDDALTQLKNNDDPRKAFDGWSEARIKAFKMIDQNPNSYYYRFNAPGEKQRNGAWNAEERRLFMSRLAEVGANGQWGIFSQSIPGRVGYQCSNYYRHLIRNRQVKDPNYIVSNDGKIHYLFGKKDGNAGTIRKHNRHPRKPKVIDLDKALDDPSSTGTRKSRRTTRKRKSKYTYDDDSDDDYIYPMDNDDSGTYHNWNTTKRTRAKYAEEKKVDENPLPGFTDPITLEEVVKPAISPYGHVMGYDSWVRCLNNPDCKNKCPITKKPLTKRELVILTFENIDEYRDKIINK